MKQESPRRSNARRFVSRSAELLERRLMLAAVSWDGGGGDGQWTNPLNWSNDALPGSADDVTIPGAATTTVVLGAGTHAVNRLTTGSFANLTVENASLSVVSNATLGGATFLKAAGSFGGAGAVQIGGTLQHLGGTLGGAGAGPVTVRAGGTLWVYSNSTPARPVLERDVTIEAGGTLLWSCPPGGSPKWTWNGATVTNFGMISVQPPSFTDTYTLATNSISGTNRLVNHGLLRKGAPQPDLTLIVQFEQVFVENFGTIECYSNSTTFAGGGINHGTIRTFQFSTVTFANGSWTHLPGADLAGVGTALFDSAAHTFAPGTFNPTGQVRFSNATATINEPFTGFTLLGLGTSRMTFNTPQTFASLPLEDGATIGGAGDITITGICPGGIGGWLGTGRTIVAPGAQLTGSARLERTIVNHGFYSQSRPLTLINGRIENMPGGFFFDNSSGTATFFGVGGNNAVVNAGTYVKNGLGASEFSGAQAGVRFDSFGQVNVDRGTLALNGGGTNSGTTAVAPGATLTHGVNGYAYQPSASISGAEGARVRFTGGTNSVGNVLNFDGFLEVFGAGTAATVNGDVDMAGSLEVTGGARAVLMHGGRIGALEVSFASRLDLTDQALVVDYPTVSQLGDVRSLLTIGYNGGAWNGAGLASSAAAANSSHGLGYAEAFQLFETFPATWAGRAVDETAVLVRYTRYGDANLDGTVNLSDFNRLAAPFGQLGTTWVQGNFNYDNATNLDDFNLLAENFGQSAAPFDVVNSLGRSPMRGRDLRHASQLFA